MKKRTDNIPKEKGTPLIEQEERDLIRRAQDGDDRAFTALVKRYENLVYSFAFKMCRNKEKAEETWQDTFVNVYRKLGQFDGKSKFSTWMYSIVTNNCLMKQRTRKLDQASVSIDTGESGQEDSGAREKESGPGAIVAWKETPLDSIISKELKTLLDEAIQQLPPEYRVVFILRDIDGQSAEETAKILRLSIPAVKSRLRRARVFLRDRLHGYMTS